MRFLHGLSWEMPFLTPPFLAKHGGVKGSNFGVFWGPPFTHLKRLNFETPQNLIIRNMSQETKLWLPRQSFAPATKLPPPLRKALDFCDKPIKVPNHLMIQLCQQTAQKLSHTRPNRQNQNTLENGDPHHFDGPKTFSQSPVRSHLEIRHPQSILAFLFAPKRSSILVICWENMRSNCDCCFSS